MNPFSEGPAGENFVGRDAQLATLDRYFDSVPASTTSGLLVVGLHGTGKSSLLEECKSMCKQKGLFPVDCDATRTDRTTAQQQLTTILREAINQLDAICPANLPYLRDHSPRMGVTRDNLAEPVFQFSDAPYFDTSALRADLELIFGRVKQLGYLGFVCLIDEAQDLDHGVIRAFRQLSGRFAGLSCVLAVRVTNAPHGTEEAGRVWLRESISAPGADPGVDRFFPRVIPLGPFSEEEARDCILKRLSSVEPRIEFPRDLISEISLVAAYVPREIIRLSYLIYDDCERDGLAEARVDQLEPAYRSIYQSMISEVTQKLNALAPTHHQRLVQLLVAHTSPVTIEVLSRELRPELWEGRSVSSRQPYRHEQEMALQDVCEAMAVIMEGCSSIQEYPDGRYGIPSAMHRAAIKLSLRMKAF